MTILTVFLPTFFLVSISPGMCMMLAMTLGMKVGLKKTTYMMWGELLGVATVTIAAVLGVSAIMMKYPSLFQWLKYFGAGYLCYVAYNMIKTSKPSSEKIEVSVISRKSLFSQGYLTAISNPKGWAFMIALLPPFIDQNAAVMPQLSLLLAIILMCELICMTLYATGGKTIAALITNPKNVQKVNITSGLLMFGIAIWLILS